MRRATFALIWTCLFLSLAAVGGRAQAGNYGYFGGGGYYDGGHHSGGYVGGGYDDGVHPAEPYYGGAYYGRGWGSDCCCRRGLFIGCGGYYAPAPVQVYVAPPPPPVVVQPACPLIRVLDGRGGWVWGHTGAC